jgi:DNA-directed RNA polymerase subunit omega
MVFSIAIRLDFINMTCSVNNYHFALKSELVKKAMEKVGNPNILINIISRRVRQLNGAGGGSSRPLISDTTGLGLGDVALIELIEDKLGYDVPEPVAAIRPSPKKRKKH